MHALKLAKPLSENQLGAVLVKGSYLLGCRVSELCHLRWQDIEPLASGGQVHLLGKGSKPRTIRVSTGTLEIFESLGRSEPEDWLFPSGRRDGPLLDPLGVGRSHS